LPDPECQLLTSHLRFTPLKAPIVGPMDARNALGRHSWTYQYPCCGEFASFVTRRLSAAQTEVGSHLETALAETDAQRELLVPIGTHEQAQGTDNQQPQPKPTAELRREAA
jgi:hypothetical protein